MPARTVLIVEDSPDIRRMIGNHLKSAGLIVTEAGDGAAGMQCLEAALPDLVCLDIMLPEVSGYELCERIRASPRLKHLPVLMISARSSPMDRAHALEAGANAFLIKPFRRAELIKLVGELVGPLEAIAP